MFHIISYTTDTNHIQKYKLYQEGVSDLLNKLINRCLELNIVPSFWTKALISPIPKGNMKNIYLHMCYHGLSLISTVAKLYSGLLNTRLTKYFDRNNIIVDEQARFRKGYACLDQAFILDSAVKDHIYQRKSTFCAFIDLEKCFDWVDRKLLYYKLLTNIGGKFFKAITSQYNNTQAKIKLNEHQSNWFNVDRDLKQGNNFSPLLASFFLNDMATGIKSLNKGMQYGNTSISLLMYADDIVLIADNENDLQLLLNCFEKWCNNWQTNCNIGKTQVVPFRPIRHQRTSFAFTIFNEKLEVVSTYKYLG